MDFAGFCKLMNSKFVTNQEAEQEILAAFKVGGEGEVLFFQGTLVS